MKHIFCTLAIVFLLTAAATAQRLPKAYIQVPGAQDEACKTRIEQYLSRTYGVSDARVNYHRHYVYVRWFPDRTNIENIKTAIANLGYTADDVKANPESYYLLPESCRHVPLVKEEKKKDSTGSKQ